jgi:hypothetical protein
MALWHYGTMAIWQYGLFYQDFPAPHSDDFFFKYDPLSGGITVDGFPSIDGDPSIDGVSSMDC